MRRRLFNLAAAVSLVLCVAAAALWVRSYFVRESVTWSVWRGSSFAASVQAFSGSGQIGFGYLEARSGAGTAHPLFGAGLKWRRWPTVAGGFHISDQWAFYRHRSSRGSVSQNLFQMPYWFPIALAAGLAAVARRMSRRLRKPGLCPACGYDLRATPDRCPECGTSSVGPVMSSA